MLKDIWNYATQHLPAWAVFIIMIFALIAVSVKAVMSRKEIREPLALWLKKRVYRVKTKDIKAHPIFSEKLLLLHKANTISFEDKLKEKVLKLFFRTMIETDMQVISDYLVRETYKKAEFSVLEAAHYIISKMSESFNVRIKQELTAFCEQEAHVSEIRAAHCADEIYEFVMLSEDGFAERQMQRIELFLDSAKSVSESMLYDDSFEEMYQLLEIIKGMLSHSVMGVERMFRRFNGRFAEIISSYKSEKNTQKA